MSVRGEKGEGGGEGEGVILYTAHVHCIHGAVALPIHVHVHCILYTFGNESEGKPLGFPYI